MKYFYFLLLVSLPAYAQAPKDAFEAARMGRLSALKVFVEKRGVPLSAQKNGSPLIFHTRSLAAAKYLAQKGAPLTDAKGKTMLMQSAAEGSTAMIRYFLKLCPVKARDAEGWTALMYLAAGKGKASAAKLLLKHGGEIDAADNEGWTPLMYAAYRGNPNLVACLLEKGANARLRNKKGANALALARESLTFAVDSKAYLRVIELLMPVFYEI